MAYKDLQARNAWHREYLRRRRAEWIAANGPCKNCGSDEDLEVDHVERGMKDPRRSSIPWSRSKAWLAEELAKCQVLCKSCHLAKTTSEVPSKLVHGTSNMYRNARCRCDACRAAHVAACKLSRQRRKERTGFDRAQK